MNANLIDKVNLGVANTKHAPQPDYVIREVGRLTLCNAQKTLELPDKKILSKQTTLPGYQA